MKSFLRINLKLQAAFDESSKYNLPSSSSKSGLKADVNKNAYLALNIYKYTLLK